MLPKFVVLASNVVFCSYLLTSWPTLVYGLALHYAMFVFFMILPHLSATSENEHVHYGGLFWSTLYMFADVTTILRETRVMDVYVYYLVYAILLLVLTFVIVALSCHTICRDGENWEDHIVELCAFVWFCTRVVNPTLRVFSIAPILAAMAVYAARNIRHVFMWACICCVEIFAPYDSSAATYGVLSLLFIIAKYRQSTLYFVLGPILAPVITLKYVFYRVVYNHEDSVYYLAHFIRGRLQLIS